ncbi:hypothetical protein FRB93_013414 [Tulasnella sp. JGI-2019a]|nr:hypothetical protein FRB93_013414 [Tulasnella sp. JGI-2019a]
MTDPEIGNNDWNSWRNGQWESLQRHCVIHISKQHASPDTISDMDATSTKLLEVLTSDLIRLSELFKEATKMLEQFKQLKDWEQDGTREGHAITLLTDAVSAHPLSDVDGRFEHSSPASYSLQNHHRRMPATPPSSICPSPPPTPTQRSELSPTNSGRRSEKSSRSKGSDKNLSSSKSTSTAGGHHHQHNYQKRRSSPTNSQHTNSSGGTATQSGADADIAASEGRRRERREAEKSRRRHMAQRIGRDAHAARTLYEKKRRDAIELERHDARMRSGGSNASVGSARSQASGSTYGDATTTGGGDIGGGMSTKPTSNPNSFELRRSAEQSSNAMEDMYKRAWAKYVAEWDKVLKQPPSLDQELHTFHTFPWPTLDPPTDLKDLHKIAIRNFIQRAHHVGVPRQSGLSGGLDLGATMNTPQETKVAMHEARLRWHPDRSPRWMAHVNDDEKARVKKGADIVIRVLNDLSEEDPVGRAG